MLDKSVVCRLVSGADVSSGDNHHAFNAVVSYDEVSVSFEDVIHHSSWLLLMAPMPAMKFEAAFWCRKGAGDEADFG